MYPRLRCGIVIGLLDAVVVVVPLLCTVASTCYAQKAAVGFGCTQTAIPVTIIILRSSS